MILGYDFFHRDCLEVAPQLCGKILCVKDNKNILKVRITETEAYRGEEDTACHASKGRTPRTELLYGESGKIYVYLCYGMHWLMNVITGEIDAPQGVLIRAGGKPQEFNGIKGKILNGPAKLTKYLGINKDYNNQNLYGNNKIWIEDDGHKQAVRTAKRVGIDYATEEYRDIHWRFVVDDNEC